MRRTNWGRAVCVQFVNITYSYKFIIPQYQHHELRCWPLSITNCCLASFCLSCLVSYAFGFILIKRLRDETIYDSVSLVGEVFIINERRQLLGK
jgi:hypothetical protein